MIIAVDSDLEEGEEDEDPLGPVREELEVLGGGVVVSAHSRKADPLVSGATGGIVEAEHDVEVMAEDEGLVIKEEVEERGLHARGEQDVEDEEHQEPHVVEVRGVDPHEEGDDADDLVHVIDKQDAQLDEQVTPRRRIALGLILTPHVERHTEEVKGEDLESELRERIPENLEIVIPEEVLIMRGEVEVIREQRRHRVEEVMEHEQDYHIW